jgi:hypothetical protein
VWGGFFKSGLILQFPTVQATIRALTQRGKLKSTNSPVTYTRTGEPVQIHSTLDQTIFLQTAATANVQLTTTPYDLHERPDHRHDSDHPDQRRD